MRMVVSNELLRRGQSRAIADLYRQPASSSFTCGIRYAAYGAHGKIKNSMHRWPRDAKVGEVVGAVVFGHVVKVLARGR